MKARVPVTELHARETVLGARNRLVGPRVIEAIAAKIERGDLTTAVADATFEGFGA